MSKLVFAQLPRNFQACKKSKGSLPGSQQTLLSLSRARLIQSTYQIYFKHKFNFILPSIFRSNKLYFSYQNPAYLSFPILVKCPACSDSSDLIIIKISRTRMLLFKIFTYTLIRVLHSMSNLPTSQLKKIKIKIRKKCFT
jgi:hypothetical protein